MHKDVLRAVALVSVCLLITLAVHAWGAAAEPRAATAVVDTQNGVIRFIIDGEERARIDASGLHVNGDLHYSGVMADTNAYASEEGAVKKGNAP